MTISTFTALKEAAAKAADAIKETAEHATNKFNQIMGTSEKPWLPHTLALIELYEAYKRTQKGDKFYATSKGMVRATHLISNLNNCNFKKLLSEISYFISHGNVQDSKVNSKSGGVKEQVSKADSKSGLGIKSLRGILISNYISPVEQPGLIDYLSESKKPDEAKVSNSVTTYYAVMWSKDEKLMKCKTKLIKRITEYINKQNKTHPGVNFGVIRAMDLANTISSSSSDDVLKSRLFKFIREGKTAYDFSLFNFFGLWNGGSGTDENSLRGIIINSLITNKEKRDAFIKGLPKKSADIDIANAIDVDTEFWAETPPSAVSPGLKKKSGTGTKN